MRTCGIDLASQPANTACCVLEWRAGVAAVTRLLPDCTDATLLDAITAADHTGIDAPFGWPDDFVRAVSAHQRGERWPAGALRDSLCMRLTDRVVARTRRPLSVSTDRIAIPAMRCAYLLDQLVVAGIPVDRAGRGRVAEVYPAVALKQWGMDPRGYKGPDAARARRALVAEFARQCPWLQIDAKYRHGFALSDHAFDAFVAALVARAVAVGATARPSADQLPLAQREGWIHVPLPGSLATLDAPPAS